MIRIYLDTEYCYPGMERGTPRPSAADQRQIVQIAAVAYDIDSGQEVASFDQLVRPTYMDSLPEFFTELTAITQDQVDQQGISFELALAKFVDFVGDAEIWTFDKDEEVLRQNCGYIDLDWPFEQTFTRVKALLSGWGVDPDAYSSGTLYRAADIQMDGHVHNALHDVRSMAAAIAVFES